jgi:hypothetical protein
MMEEKLSVKILSAPGHDERKLPTYKDKGQGDTSEFGRRRLSDH